MSALPHQPVMLDEVTTALRPGPGKLIIDATFGAGGYSRALLGAGARVIAFDRDPSALPYAAAFAAHPFALIEAPFSAMEDHIDEPVDGVAIDLGVSSMQLDEPERGFSFQADGPLDMRMGRTGPTAASLVNEAEPAELARMFRDFGEEKNRAGAKGRRATPPRASSRRCGSP
jgi:16S rRNA (cytosine1402-N4)-methyltransferase